MSEKTYTPPLAGKVALVTGASYGIGRAIAERLARDGATAALSDITDRVDGTVAEMQAEGLKASSLRLDINHADSVEQGVAEVVRRHGGLDIVVCNAAGPRSSKTILEMSAEDWGSHLDTNTRGTLFTIQSAAKAIIAGGKGGRIIALASMAALRPYQRRSHYSASKAGIIALARVAALEFAEHGITVNCVAPGSTQTENREKMAAGWLNAKEGEEMRARAARTPLGMVQPSDIAAAVAYLASPDAGRITGQTLLVDGGALLI